VFALRVDCESLGEQLALIEAAEQVGQRCVRGWFRYRAACCTIRDDAGHRCVANQRVRARPVCGALDRSLPLHVQLDGALKSPESLGICRNPLDVAKQFLLVPRRHRAGRRPRGRPGTVGER
jgi:hypothetical protein